MHPHPLWSLGGARTAPPRGLRIPENAPLATQARYAFSDQRPVDDAVATGGHGAALGAVRLARVLGDNAWRTWAALLGVRDTSGETHVTTRALVARTGIPTHGVKRALARLRGAGLVVDVGWMVRTVPCHRCADTAPHEHEVFTRAVRGQLREGSRGGLLVRVPRAVEAWSLVAPAHGGRRSGAGRPTGSKDTRPRIRTPKEEAPAMPPRRKTPPGAQDALAAPAPPAYRPPPPVVAPERSAPPSRAAAFEPSPAGGIVLAGPATLAVHPAAELVAVPMFPGANVVPPAVVPEPPLLSADASDEELFRACVAAFRTVHEHDVGSTWFRPHHVLERDRAAVTGGARLLRAHGIRPLRWAQWSFGVWREVAKKDGPPFFRWAFLGTRIDEHHGWFHAAWGSYSSGRVVLGPTHRELLARHGRMTSAIRRGVRPRDAVASFFPGDTYDRMVAAARLEAESLQRDLSQRVRAGELID